MGRDHSAFISNLTAPAVLSDVSSCLQFFPFINPALIPTVLVAEMWSSFNKVPVLFVLDSNSEWPSSEESHDTGITFGGSSGIPRKPLDPQITKLTAYQ